MSPLCWVNHVVSSQINLYYQVYRTIKVPFAHEIWIILERYNIHICKFRYIHNEEINERSIININLTPVSNVKRNAIIGTWMAFYKGHFEKHIEKVFWSGIWSISSTISHQYQIPDEMPPYSHIRDPHKKGGILQAMYCAGLTPFWTDYWYRHFWFAGLNFANFNRDMIHYIILSSW